MYNPDKFYQEQSGELVIGNDRARFLLFKVTGKDLSIVEDRPELEQYPTVWVALLEAPAGCFYPQFFLTKKAAMSFIA